MNDWHNNERRLYKTICSNAYNGEIYIDEPWKNPIYLTQPGDDPFIDDEIDHLLALMQTEEALCLCGTGIPCSLEAYCDACGVTFPRRRQYNTHDIRVTWVIWQCFGNHLKGDCHGVEEKKVGVKEEKEVRVKQENESDSVGHPIRVNRDPEEQLSIKDNR